MSIEETLAKALRAGSKALFECDVMQDYKDSANNRIRVR
jgi:hypothetical protein